MTAPRQSSRDPIREALQQLPRTAASDDFSRRLLERLGRRERRPAWPLRVAAALLLVAVATGLSLVHRHNQRLEREEQRAAIERRHQELRRDLADLRERAARSPKLYLGSASDFDLVLDLEPWMEQPLAIRPAAYTGARP